MIAVGVCPDNHKYKLDPEQVAHLNLGSSFQDLPNH